MSRFSLAEARGLGWDIVHSNPDGAGGKPKSIVAQKLLNAPGFPNTLVREEAHSMGLLLERVFAYEAHLTKRGYTPYPATEPAPEAPVSADDQQS